MSENKETKQEVTNEQILEHLKEIEIAQGCLANGINALFSVIDERKEQLKLSRLEAEMIEQGQISLDCLADHMFNISGMREERDMRQGIHAVSKEDVEGFLDFLKEILS